MVWPQGCAKRTVTNTMAFLRRRLGNDPNANRCTRSPATANISTACRHASFTDWDRFAALAKRAERLPDGEALPLLDRALELVDGPPFQAKAGYS
jgi:hypothetical protein